MTPHRFRQASLLTLIATLSFAGAYLARVWHARRVPPALPAGAASIPDSVRLAKIDLAPGRQLIAYVLGGSKCASCRSEEVKTAIRGLRVALRSRFDRSYRTIRVVGVGINTDVREGLAYLEGVGLDAFDEISVGNGWQNQHVVRLVWRDAVAEPAAPQIILFSRTMTAELSPLSVRYSADSLIAVIAGRAALQEWLRTTTGRSEASRVPRRAGATR